MNLTSRRKRPLDRTLSYLRDTKLIIIATEGKYAEKQYFQIFKSKSSRVQIQILETKDNRSSPRDVLNRLRKFKSKFDIHPDDQLWLVIDKDRWTDDHLAKVAQCTLKNCFKLAVSRPCFEVWLYLHHDDPPPMMGKMTGKEVKAELRRLLGSYNEKKLQVSLFEPNIENAIGRAIKLDNQPNERWPIKLGTHVYRLVQAIRDFISL